MELSSILPPVHQGHQQLVCAPQLGWSPELSQACFNYFQHLIKGFALDASQPFKIRIF